MRKIIIIISIVLFIAIAGLAIYVQSDAFAAMIRPYVTERVAAALGEDVKIGWVKANLVPPYVEVRDISIPDAQGREVVAIHKIRAFINPLPLLIKRISLPLIAVFDPRVTAERGSDGEINITHITEKIVRRVSASSSSGSAAYSVVLRTITIKRGEARFVDKKSSDLFSATDIAMDAKINLRAGNARIAVKSARLHAVFANHPPVTGTLQSLVTYHYGKVTVDSLEFASGDSRFTASGTMGPPPAAALDFKMRCRFGPDSVARFVNILPFIKKTKGPVLQSDVDLKGTLSNPELSGAFKAAGVSFNGVTLQDAALTFTYRDKALDLAGSGWKISKGSDQKFVVDSISASVGYREAGFDIYRCTVLAGDASVNLQGRFDLAKGFASTLVAESSGAGKTLSFFTSTPLQGRLGVRGELTGDLTSPSFDGTLYAGPITVRGTQFQEVSGSVGYHDKKVLVSATDIYQQSSRYILNGTIDLSGKETVYTGKLKVMKSDVAPIVAIFYKTLPLTISASGELSFTGTRRDFTGTGYLSLASGKAYGEAFDKGTVSVSLTRDRISFPQVVVYKGSGIVTASGWIGFDRTYSSILESSFVDLSEVNYLKGLPLAGPFKLDVRSYGNFSNPRLTASLASPALSYSNTALGGLTAEAEINDRAISVRADIDGGSALVNGNLALRAPYEWTANVTINSEGITPFVMLENRELVSRAKMTADGAVRLRGEGTNAAAVSGTAVFQKLSLSLGDYRIENDGESSFTVAGGKLAIKSLRFTGPGTRLAVSGGVRLAKDVDIALSGSANLSLLRLLYREVEFGEGEAEVALTIKEGWNNPEVSGELRLKNGEIKIKDVPQKFTALNGKVRFDQKRIVADALMGEVGGGNFKASGRAQLTGLKLQDFSARIGFESVTVRYPQGVVSTLSGDLYYDGNASEQLLSGDVTVKRAQYDKRLEWKSMLVDVTRGFYQKRKTDIGWIGDTQINVRFHGKEGIVIQNNLGKVPVDVDIFIRGTVSQPQLLGRVETRKGVIYFRKNDFRILHASVDFIDPNRMNPMLDVLAETTVREYQIRLAVAGDADRAVVTLVSYPPLSDADILSLLALGKTSYELTGKESGVGVGEATAFASGQIQDIIERSARTLTGLDRFQVDPAVGKGDTSVPRLTVGKEVIQDKLNVTFSSNVGASAPEQVFRIEYILNKHFSVLGGQDESGNIGADIKYRFEFK